MLKGFLPTYPPVPIIANFNLSLILSCSFVLHDVLFPGTLIVALWASGCPSINMFSDFRFQFESLNILEFKHIDTLGSNLHSYVRMEV